MADWYGMSPTGVLSGEVDNERLHFEARLGGGVPLSGGTLASDSVALHPSRSPVSPNPILSSLTPDLNALDDAILVGSSEFPRR